MKLNKQWNTLSNQIKKIKILKKKAKKEKYDKIKMNSNKSNSSSWLLEMYENEQWNVGHCDWNKGHWSVFY